MNNIMREDWTECIFEDLLDYEQPTKYIVESTKYSDDYKTPVLTAGKTFIKGYTNETNGIFDNLPTIIFDDFTTASQYVNFKFKVKSSAMKILVPTSKLVNMQFVFYAMQVNQVRNDTHKRYWISVYAKKKLLFPSLIEQRAIVSKIESLFSDLDNGIANLKKAQGQLKIYRQAVLKKAFEGELTKEWREKRIIKKTDNNNVKKIHEFSRLPTAEELLQQIKEEGQNHYNKQLEEWEKAVKEWDKAVKKNNNNNVKKIHEFSQQKKPTKPKAPKELPPLTEDELKELQELPEGWEWVINNTFFSFVTSGSRGWAKYYSNEGAVFIRITNLNFNTLKLDLSDSKIQRVNIPTGSEGIRTEIQEDDFLFSITGYLGMFAIAPKGLSAYVNQHVALCRPYENIVKKYLGFWNISKTGGIHYLNKNQKGAVKAGLNLDDLKTFPVPLCSIPEQNQIVQEIETRLSVCNKVEQSISESLEKAKALRQSILKKAFEGKLLTEQEIEQCKKEPGHEPASVLLARIERSRNEKIEAGKLASLQQAQGKKKQEAKKTKKKTRK